MTKVSTDTRSLFLGDANKTYVVFNGGPSVTVEPQTYTSRTPVKTSTIDNLARIQLKVANGDEFFIQYVNSTISDNECLGMSPNPAPCSLGYITGPTPFIAECSVEPQYLAVCDQIMDSVIVSVK